jgi:pyruvate formate lyase activating enzyme
VRFAGFQPFSLSDFPGCISAIVFTQGCNFRCPFCHNGELVDDSCAGYSQEDILDFLAKRQGRLKGLVVTGGEPTIQPELPGFLAKVKALGYKIKLDTNGYKPKTIANLIDAGLVDYIAMDIKGPYDRYSAMAGLGNLDISRVKESVALVANSGLEHQFRTTKVLPMLDQEDWAKVPSMVPVGSLHKWQDFRPEKTLAPVVRVPRILAGEYPDSPVAPAL